jgi:periplasmic protein TonB
MGIREYFKKDKNGKRLKASFALAFFFHAGVFLIGSLSLATQAEYGMEGAVAPASRPQATPPAVEETIDFEEFALADTTAPKPKPTPISIPTPEAAAPVATDPVLAAPGGSIEVPTYFRNPPPPYPAEARKLKQEGLVLLRASVDSQGLVSAVTLRQSSGFPALDDAARRTVAGWKFKPARMAGIAVSTEVDIPVRFRLKDTR